jgi:hypothetical protein
MIAVPSDANIRLAQHGGEWVVSVARAGAPEVIADAMARPGLSGIVTHDRGLSWPDRRGEALATALLAQPGAVVFLLFASLADALGCRRRLEGGRH